MDDLIGTYTVQIKFGGLIVCEWQLQKWKSHGNPRNLYAREEYITVQPVQKSRFARNKEISPATSLEGWEGSAKKAWPCFELATSAFIYENCTDWSGLLNRRFVIYSKRAMNSCSSESKWKLIILKSQKNIKYTNYCWNLLKNKIEIDNYLLSNTAFYL